MLPKKILAILLVLLFLAGGFAAALLISFSSSLPNLITAADYEPLLVTEVFDRNQKKIGEFYREKRTLTAYEDFPEKLIQAFISAEDSSFFSHGGLNYIAIIRAMMSNLRTGRRGQGGSTITQQVARSLLLSSEKTYTRKIKEALLSYKMEAHLTKEEILWLYFNQIYLGQGAYGVEVASQVYFRKPVKEITVPEAALLAGLPQAPSRYSPISNPSAAKERQIYVLNRMADEGYITRDEAQAFINEPLKVYLRQNYREMAPYFLESLRQLLVAQLGEAAVLDKGLRVYTGLDIDKQIEAQNQVRSGLRALDKRQGYRGPLENIEEPEKIAEFLLKTRNSLLQEFSPLRVINPDGTIDDLGPLNLTGKDKDGKPLPTVPAFISLGQNVPAVVTKVDDNMGLVYVRFAESKGIIDIDSMTWARKPDTNLRADNAKISKPSEALKTGDVIEVQVFAKNFQSERIDRLKKENKAKKVKNKALQELPDFNEYAQLELEQEPLVEGSLVSVDIQNGDVLALVGGYDFARSEFNRALQAARQTGSSFKAFVFMAALDKGYTPVTPILDAPLVYEEEGSPEAGKDAEEIATKRWRPANHSKKYAGEILFRNALIRSLNIPAVKVIEKIGVDWTAQYARRLGIVSPLNMDFTLALGSSGVTLYEMTKAFAELGRMGKRIRPVIVHKVLDKSGEEIMGTMSLDERFKNELVALETDFEEKRLKFLETQASKVESEEPREEGQVETKNLTAKNPLLYFENPDQLIRPQTAYVVTSLLQGAIDEPGGTGGAARALGRPAAGKTGSTSGYYDAWFMGYTPDIATGVWVGFDQERSLGRGEVGGRSALPIWLEYMKKAHEDLPVKSFPAPEGIVFVNIDNETGRLPSTSSKQVVRQAFIEGTEPQESNSETKAQDEQDFFKEDLAE